MTVKITKITPRGFCSGVVNAWMMIEKYIKNNPNKKIYMIGWFVHNKFMVEKIIDMGVIILDDSNKSRYEIIDNLVYEKNSAIIFSAHGTDDKAIELSRKKGFEIIDTTCIYVKNIQEIIKEKILDGKKIIFFGKKKHPESLSMLSINNIKIKICESIDEINKVLEENPKDDWFFTNQTTIGLWEYQDVLDHLKTKNINIEIQNDICYATNERQEAINKLENVDLLIVVGDLKSNNSKKLYELGLNKNINTILIENYEQLNDKTLKNKKHIAITSGASTPTWITNDVIKWIEEKTKNAV
ncbi:MAG: 4-hydroxy-3-methylbut-2-enyl diphosphate reductase [Mycoplasmoidaceae bacterium]